MTRKNEIRRAIGTLALTGTALVVGLGASLAAFAEGKGIDEPFREGYRKALAGKTVAYVPVALGFDLAQGSARGSEEGTRAARRQDRRARSELEHERRRPGGDRR